MRLAITLLAALLLTTTGCGSSLRTLTAMGGTQTELLHETVNRYTQALYWGSPEEAARYVAPERLGEFYVDFKNLRKSEKLVDSVIEDVRSLPNGQMSVSLAVRYYRIPTYLIESRVEDQIWEFRRYAGGWRYLERKSRKVEAAS